MTKVQCELQIESSFTKYDSKSGFAEFGYSYCSALLRSLVSSLKLMISYRLHIGPKCKVNAYFCIDLNCLGEQLSGQKRLASRRVPRTCVQLISQLHVRTLISA